MSLLSSIAHRLTERVRAVRWMASRPRPADRDVGRLFEITFDLMGVASLDGTMLRVNPGIERVLGLAPEKVVGRRLFDIVHPDDRQGTVAAFAGALEAGHLSGFEDRLSAADGSYRWLQWNLLAEADEGLVYGVARDVTEHRRAERELRGAQRELEGSREELRVLSDEQASLRRVAVVVAGGAASADVFEAIAREVAHVLRPRRVQILRWERDGTVTVVGTWGDGPNPFPAGSNWPWEDPSLSGLMERMRAGELIRIEDVAGVRGARGRGPQRWGRFGRRSADRRRRRGVGPHERRDGGGCAAARRCRGRLAELTEMVAAAISSSATREQFARLADEQAALRRVATLVARGAPPADVFDAVAEELGRLLEVGSSGLVRFENEHTARVVAGWGRLDEVAPVGARLPIGGANVITEIARSGKAARVDDFERSASGPIGDQARRLKTRSAIGGPIVGRGAALGRDGRGGPRGRPAAAGRRAAARAVHRADRHRDRQHRGARRARPARGRAGRAAAGRDAGGGGGAGGGAVRQGRRGGGGRLRAADRLRDPPLRGRRRRRPWWRCAGSSRRAASGWTRGCRSTAAAWPRSVFRERRPVRVDDYAAADGAIAEHARTHGIRSAVGCPIVVRGRVWGAMVVAHYEPEPFPPETERRVVAVHGAGGDRDRQRGGACRGAAAGGRAGGASPGRDARRRGGRANRGVRRCHRRGGAAARSGAGRA